MEITNATVALAALGQTTRLAVFRLLVEAGPSGRMAGEIASGVNGVRTVRNEGYILYIDPQSLHAE